MYQQSIIYGEVLGAGLLADIASPEGDGPFPVMLSVHGGRWIRGTRRDNGAIDVRRWADEFGFFAMNIEYRLVTCTPAPACARWRSGTPRRGPMSRARTGRRSPSRPIA